MENIALHPVSVSRGSTHNRMSKKFKPGEVQLSLCDFVCQDDITGKREWHQRAGKVRDYSKFPPHTNNTPPNRNYLAPTNP